MDELRTFLESALGRTPREDVVEYMDQKGMVAQLSKGDKGETTLLAEYHLLERQFHHEPPTVIEVPGDDRCQALGRILAAEASRREDVIEFRKTYLIGKLLAPTAVVGWVKAKTKGGGGKDEKRTAPKASVVRQGQTKERPGQFAADRIYFHDTLNDNVCSVQLSGAAPLVDLKALVSELCLVHNVWSEPFVTDYVLTGAPPPVPLARIELQQNPLWPSESRMCLVIDPTMVSLLPFKIFVEAKDILPEGHRRKKALSSKHLELAVWGENKRAEPDKSWDMLLSEWNAQHPDWAYKAASAPVHFARDARAAWTKVTGRNWE